jgi:NAD(P)-dependent dehydrogenase (short-subunit alcohol dehydrogenase family)
LRVALVTGGARGIGRACAQRLAADGCRVVIADRDGAQAAAAEIEHAEAESVDLAQATEVEALAARVLERHGRCDVLVNNAAQLGMHAFEDVDLVTWRRFEAVSVEAPFLLCIKLIPAMVSAGAGRVINIVSNTVWNPPGPGFVPYITMKGALLGMTRALAVEYGRLGVTVNAVAPGLTPTPGSTEGQSQSAFDAVVAQQAIGRTLAPEDIAGAVGYLASDQAAAVTGQAIRVDGGLVTL